MFNRRTIAFFLLFIISVAITADEKAFSQKDTKAPTVVSTVPENGAKDVDPSLKEISVTFSEPMMDKSWSWCYEKQSSFPQIAGQPYYAKDSVTNRLPVKLEPGREYIIWINTAKQRNFKDLAGNPAVPYKFSFKTK